MSRRVLLPAICLLDKSRNGAFLEKTPKLAEDFVRITQKVYAACVADFEPCLKALMDQVSGRDGEERQLQRGRTKYLMADEFTATRGLGWIDQGWMRRDFELVWTDLGMEKPFPAQSAFTRRLLDPSVKMDASKMQK